MEGPVEEGEEGVRSNLLDPIIVIVTSGPVAAASGAPAPQPATDIPPKKKRRRKTPYSGIVPSQATLRKRKEARRKADRERQALRRANMTEEEKERNRMKCRTSQQLYRSTIKGTEEGEQQALLNYLKGQIRNKIKMALETPADREKRLVKDREDRRATGKKQWYQMVETPDERKLREILVREAFAVEVGAENEMKQFEMLKGNRLKELRAKRKIETKPKPKHPKKMSRAEREMHSFWEHDSEWDGILSSGDEDEDGGSRTEYIEISSSDEDGKKGPEESVEEWAVRVSDIFNARIQRNQPERQAKQKQSTSKQPPATTATNSKVVQAPEENADLEDLKCVLQSKEDLISAVSAEKAERVVLVEAEIAERRAALSEETEAERKTRIELMFEDAKKTRVQAKENWKKRLETLQQRKLEAEDPTKEKTSKERVPPKKRSEMTEEEKKQLNKQNAEYMRERSDLLKAEWETWVGLRDASAPPGMTGVASEVTGIVNVQGALAWLQENMEDHRWGIEKGASVKMGKKVPEPVKKYRLSLATMIDKDEKRSGPNAKKVAETTLLQLLTTERNVFEEFFYNRRTYIQRMSTKWQSKMGLEKKAERRAKINESLREKYKAKRLTEGKSYAPETRGQSLIKDKDTLLKEMTGEIPRSTRGITKNRSRWRQANPIVRDGRVLPVSGVRFNKPPGQREYSHDGTGKDFCGSGQRKPTVSVAPNKNTWKDQPEAPAPQLTTEWDTPAVPTLVSVSAPSSSPKKPSRSRRKNKTREETPPPPSPPSPPPQEDSDSDWAGPADVDESLFDDDDSRDAGSVEQSATPPALNETWNNHINPPTLQPFSTLSHSHTHSLFPHASYLGAQQNSQTYQAFPPPIDVGHGLLLGNPVPSFPTTQTQQQQIQHHYNQEASPYSSAEGQGYTESYASSTYSDDPDPPTLFRKDSDYTPPQKKRRGRPPSSSGASSVTRLNKIRKSRTREKRIVSQTLLRQLRPEITFSEGKLPIVTHPLLLSNPAENSGETTEKAVAEPEPHHDPIEKTAETVKCPECPEEFEDDEKMNCHKDEKHAKVKEKKEKKLKKEQNEDVVDEEEEDLKEEQTKGKKRVVQPVSLNCPVCNLVVKGGNVFTNHLWTVHWKDERKSDLGSCPVCLRSLKGQGARFFFYLTRHIKSYHADIKKDSFFPGFKTPEKQRGGSYKKFYCVICSSNFPAYLPLAKHIEHGHSRACHVCGIILQVSDHLRDHVEMFHPQENYIPQEPLSQEQLKDQVRCVRCLSKFVDASYLKSHEKDCQEEKVMSSFQCWWSCSNSKSETFRTYEALEEHNDECHREDTVVPTEGYDNLHCVYKCEVCVQRFYTLPFLRLHYMKDHPEAPALPEVTSLEPVMVPNIRPQLNEPANKIVTNARNRPSQYAKSTEFPDANKNTIFNTVVSSSCKTDAPTYTCGECPKTVNANEFCRLHRGYRKARRRVCRICGAQYSHIESLIGHNKTKHGISAEENTRLENEYDEERLKLAKEKQEPILKCAVCLMSFVAKDFHTMHSTVGDELDPDVRYCPHCPNLSFCKNKLLTAHMELCHSDPKTAAKAAKRLEESKQKHKDTLVRLRQQAVGQDWPCEECGAIFSLKTSLQRHKRTTHSGIGKRFQCPHCDQKSSRIEQLRNHIKAIHQLGGRPSTQKSKPPRVHIPDKKCSMCIKKFATEGALQIHVKKVHGQDTLCYACGDSVKDIKAHNSVCPMGGMEEDAMIRDDDEQATGTSSSWRAQKVAKLPLLALLKIALEQRDKELIRPKNRKTKEAVGKAGKLSKAKDEVDDETDEDDLDESEYKSSKKKRLRNPKPSKGKKKPKDDEPKLKKSRGSKRHRETKKNKKNHESSEDEEPKPKEKKRHKRTKESSKESNAADKLSPKVDRPKRIRKKKKQVYSDEESNENDNRDWENEVDTFEEEIIVVKEEVDDTDSCFEIDLPDGFSIKPDETVCSKHNCPCENGKWDAIVHGDQSMIVKLVRCDPEVEALEKEKELRRKKAEKALEEKEKAQQRYVEKKKAEQLKKEKIAEQRRKQRERAKQRKKDREQFYTSRIDEEIRSQQSRVSPRVYDKKPIEVVDPDLIAHSMPFDVKLRSGTPPFASSQSAGWRQLNHIAKPTVAPKESESSDNEDDTNDPTYDPLAL